MSQTLVYNIYFSNVILYIHPNASLDYRSQYKFKTNQSNINLITIDSSLNFYLNSYVITQPNKV